jgi:hypothetical protein
LEIGNTASSIVYEVEEPEVRDVVLNESYALKLEWRPEKLGPFFSGAWTHKPMNQFHLGIDISNSLRTDRGDELTPVIHPVLVKHDLLTFEAGFDQRDYKFFVSHTIEKIKNPGLPDSWEQTKLMDAEYQGLGIRHLADIPFARSSEILWMFARRKELGGRLSATRIEGNIEASTQRMAFREWAQLSWITDEPVLKGKRLKSEVSYRYSSSDQGQWLSMDSTLVWNKRWSFYVSADILGAKDNVDLRQESFISLYKNNDRIEGGMIYVF